MPWGVPVGLGRSPRDAPPLVELDDVVLPDVALRRPHGEDITEGANPLPAKCLGQVVVAVPPRLLSRIGNKLEDHPGAGCYLAACADDALTVIVIGHASHRITSRKAHRQSHPSNRTDMP